MVGPVPNHPKSQSVVGQATGEGASGATIRDVHRTRARSDHNANAHTI
jgi:hypothetical protein